MNQGNQGESGGNQQKLGGNQGIRVWGAWVPRISMSTGYPFPKWNVADSTKAAAQAVIDEMFERGFMNLDDTMGDKLKDLKSPVFNLFYGITGDWDVAVWMLLQTTRACGAIPNYEEPSNSTQTLLKRNTTTSK